MLSGCYAGKMDRALKILKWIVVAATLLPLSRSSRWWIRSLDFPRGQIALLGAAALGTDLALRPRAGTAARLTRGAAALCVLYQLHKIRPYTVFARTQVQRAQAPRPETNIRLMLANVLMNNRNAARLREVISQADPDVVLVVEADRWWQSSLEQLSERYPFTVQQPQDNTYGMLLYSRLELIDPEIRFLVEDDIPSIRTRLKLPLGTEVELHCLHPRPPVPQESAESTQRDAELMVVGKEVKGKQLPMIVMGDLNDVAWSRTNDLFQKVSKLLDPRMGRGLYNSFHARYFFLRFPLDHFFHSAHFRLLELRRLPYFGSDHFPMYIRLSYEPEAEHQQDPMPADRSDEAEAEEKIEQASARRQS